MISGSFTVRVPSIVAGAPPVESFNVPGRDWPRAVDVRGLLGQRGHQARHSGLCRWALVPCGPRIEATLAITAAEPSCSGSSCALKLGGRQLLTPILAQNYEELRIEITRASAMSFTISRGPYTNSEYALISLPSRQA